MDVSSTFENFNNLPENTSEEIDYKQEEYEKLLSGENWWRLKVLADIQVAQFFIPKTQDNESKLITDAEYSHFLIGKQLVGLGVSEAIAVAQEKKFFHWFLEFPEVFAKGGFDCILGNPPYLHSQKLSGIFGYEFLNYIKTTYAPAGICDLVVNFLRRIYSLIKENSFFSLITTNSISEGNNREGGLDIILEQRATINFVLKSMKWTGQANLYVSVLSVFKGEWNKVKFLDNKQVDFISSYFDDSTDIKKPLELPRNQNKIYVGSYFLGDGFILTSEEKENIISKNLKNKEVIFPLLNGKNINDEFDQKPQRYIINFFDWTEEKSKAYYEPYLRVRELVKPIRDLSNRAGRKEKWWQYAEKSVNLYSKIKNQKICFAACVTTKYLNFSVCPTNIIFATTLYVYCSEKFSDYSIVQSTIHEIWARKYSSTLGMGFRYTPSVCFETFPFPIYLLETQFNNIEEKTILSELEFIGNEYHDFRKSLMYKIKVGLTDTYNFFHRKDLTVDEIIKKSKQDFEVCNEAYQDIIKLRELHKEMDNTVLKAYGWEDLYLSHDFYDVDYLPENDRVRYTISPEARKEILKRLLLLNHEIHEKENSPLTPLLEKEGKKIKSGSKQTSLFPEPEQVSLFD